MKKHYRRTDLILFIAILHFQKSPISISRYNGLVQADQTTILNHICIGTGFHNSSYYSIGQKLMRSDFHGIFEEDLSTLNLTTYTTTKVIHVKVYPVKAKKRVLNGWLHVEIHSPTHFFNFVYAQVENEFGNPIGEFVDEKVVGSCDKCPYHPQSPKPANDFYFPCPAAGPTETHVPQVLLAVTPSTIIDSERKAEIESKFPLGSKGIKYIDFLWRFSHYVCNKPEKIRVRVFANAQSVKQSLSKTGFGLYYRSNWLVTGWVGASDVVSPGESLSCHDLELGDPTRLDPSVSWIVGIEPVEVDYSDDVVSKKGKVCKNVVPNFEDLNVSEDLNLTSRSEESVRVSSFPIFSGRCAQANDYEAFIATLHKCSNESETTSMEKYPEYLEGRLSCMKVSGCPCQCPNLPMTVNTLGTRCDGRTSTTSGPKPSDDLVTLGIFTNSTAGQNFVRGRKGHALAMIFVTMNLVPWTIIVSRYFKESWLSSARANVHVWYWVHLGVTFCILCGYVTADASLSHSTTLLGTSLSSLAAFHRRIGILTIIIYVATFLTGPFRHVDLDFKRQLMMIAHAVLGVLYYLLGMISIMSSSWIPGSPSADDESCHTSYQFFNRASEFMMPLVFGWIAVDIIIHLLMTRIMLWADRGLELERRMYFPLLSVLRGDQERHNMKGFRYRNGLLIVYALVNVIITIRMIVRVVSNDLAGCGFGAMSCTHKSEDSMLSEFTCGLREKYLHKL